MESINNITLTGRLTADATTNESKSFARFAIAHNMGKDKTPVFANFVMFAKNGRFTNEIPFDLLKKGTPVKVEAYMYPDGKSISLVVKSVTVIPNEEAEASA